MFKIHLCHVPTGIGIIAKQKNINENTVPSVILGFIDHFRQSFPGATIRPEEVVVMVPQQKPPPLPALNTKPLPHSWMTLSH
ncbi:MAG: hypothetical protein OEV93_00250 [Candidatus Moranbacteria bacterium]|nr:hypothetical protein [Candidatus Moranbacteria bacterium]